MNIPRTIITKTIRENTEKGLRIFSLSSGKCLVKSMARATGMAKITNTVVKISEKGMLRCGMLRSAVFCMVLR